jgi:hypothetical protein
MEMFDEPLKMGEKNGRNARLSLGVKSRSAPRLLEGHSSKTRNSSN